MTGPDALDDVASTGSTMTVEEAEQMAKRAFMAGHRRGEWLFCVEDDTLTDEDAPPTFGAWLDEERKRTKR